MSDDEILYDPTSDKWALSDGEHYLEVPHWAREIIVNEFERETRQLKADLQRRTEQFEGMCEMWVERGVENHKLREQIDAAHMSRLLTENENESLRELLTYYLGCLTKGHVNCDSCAFAEDVCERGRKVIDWARELGVEVDE